MVDRFQKAFAAYTGAKRALARNNGMCALAEIIGVSGAGVGADVAFLDRGAVKAGIAPGKGTWWDIYRIHPWRNQVLLATCTGRQVQEALSKLDLLFAGCSCLKIGPAVADLKIGGLPADPNRSYTVAINDYLFWTTPLLKDLPYCETAKRVDTLLVQRLKGRKINKQLMDGGNP